VLNHPIKLCLPEYSRQCCCRDGGGVGLLAGIGEEAKPAQQRTEPRKSTGGMSAKIGRKEYAKYTDYKESNPSVVS
jgi:hypothetical protein